MKKKDKDIIETASKYDLVHLYNNSFPETKKNLWIGWKIDDRIKHTISELNICEILVIVITFIEKKVDNKVSIELFKRTKRLPSTKSLRFTNLLRERERVLLFFNYCCCSFRFDFAVAIRRLNYDLIRHIAILLQRENKKKKLKY